MFRRILIANRGEIAVRIIRTLKRMGIETVAIFSGDDEGALHTRTADMAFHLEGNSLDETYLNAEKIINIAIRTGSGAIHPGYGFLSENAAFAESATEQGITFIGPPPGIIRLMGDKARAKAVMSASGIPIIPGIKGDPGVLMKFMGNGSFSFPLMIKASAGGGGKAMRKVRNLNELEESLEISSREAMNYFGDPGLILEKYFEDARHIEVQVLADCHGNVFIPGERECSIQRRFQKVIEETPAVFLDEETRERMTAVTRRIVEETGYINAGTIEYLVDGDRNFYFLEMNPRIQVEHTVTEMVTGIDIVEQQVLIAAGNPLGFDTGGPRPGGHAIEARIYAEDPCNGFMPVPGRITDYREPEVPGIRIDAGISGPDIMLPGYDPLIAKVIAAGKNRAEAIGRLKKALREYFIAGTVTNRSFLLNLLDDKVFLENRISTGWLELSRERLAAVMNEKAALIPRPEIFALWLAAGLYGNQKGEKAGVWESLGYWRHEIRKSLIFGEKQYDLFITDRKKDGFSFETGGKLYHAGLKKTGTGRIILGLGEHWISGTVSAGSGIEDTVFTGGYEFRLKPLDFLPSEPFTTEQKGKTRSGLRIIKSPLHGKIVKMNAAKGEMVARGELLFILDAMKIENKIISPFDGKIKEVRVNTGDQVVMNQTVLVIE